MVSEFDAPLPDPAGSVAVGRAHRAAVPRSTLGELAARPDGFDAVGVLLAQGADRVQSLLPLRYERMTADQFGYLRGAAAVMAADLSHGPSSGLVVQLGGDAHLSNFGVFLSAERRVAFDVNDFDETLPGPFEWDVKRLVASVVVAGAVLDLPRRQRERAALAAARAYRVAMRRFAEMPTFEVWSARLDMDRFFAAMGGALSDEAARQVKASEVRGSQPRFGKLVTYDRGIPAIAADPPLIVPFAKLAATDQLAVGYDALVEILARYAATLAGDRRRLLELFTPFDAARKVVGVGSVGTRCFALLLLGRDDHDPFFLQVKEASASVLEAHLGPCALPSHSQRVVAGQQLMQATPDPLLGWVDDVEVDGGRRSFYVRQLYDGRASARIASLDAPMLRAYARACGWTLARAHARSGDRIAIASYLGASDAFDEAMGAFALAYARRTREDHAALTAAIASGRVPTAHP